MKKVDLKLLDTVAVLKDVPQKRVVFGQVETIVEKLADGVFEVEFADKFGETIAELAVSQQDLMLLHYEMEFSE